MSIKYKKCLRFKPECWNPLEGSATPLPSLMYIYVISSAEWTVSINLIFMLNYTIWICQYMPRIVTMVSYGIAIGSRGYLNS